MTQFFDEFSFGSDFGDYTSEAPVIFFGNGSNIVITGNIGEQWMDYSTYAFDFDVFDTFKFVAPVSGTYYATLSGLTGDADLSILKSDGYSFVDYSMNSGTQNEYVYGELAAGSTYYLRVTDFTSYTATTDYRLDISYSSFSAGSDFDDSSYDDYDDYDYYDDFSVDINPPVTDSKDGSGNNTSSDSKNGVDNNISSDTKGGVISDLTMGGVGSGNTFFVTSGIDTLIYQNYSLSDLTIESMGSNLAEPYDFSEDWRIEFSSNDSKSGGVFGVDEFSGERIDAIGNTSVALDLDYGEDSAGTALGLLFTGFGTIPDEDILGYWIGQADDIWEGMIWLSDMEKAELLAQEIMDYYVPNGLSNDQVANLVVSNLLERPLSVDELAVFTNMIDDGTFTQAEFYAEAASLDEYVVAQYWDEVQGGLYYSQDSKMG